MHPSKLPKNIDDIYYFIEDKHGNTFYYFNKQGINLQKYNKNQHNALSGGYITHAKYPSTKKCGIFTNLIKKLYEH